MANGFHGTEEEWNRIEAPLREVDNEFATFSSRHGLTLSKNGKWPQRSFRWGVPLSRLIQLYLEDEEIPAYTLWIAATEDRAGARYWKRFTYFKGKSMIEITPVISTLLEEAFALVSSWKESDLEFATTLASHRTR